MTSIYICKTSIKNTTSIYLNVVVEHSWYKQVPNVHGSCIIKQGCIVLKPLHNMNKKLESMPHYIKKTKTTSNIYVYVAMTLHRFANQYM